MQQQQNVRLDIYSLELVTSGTPTESNTQVVMVDEHIN